MQPRKHVGSRLVMIVLATILFGGVVFLVGTSLQESLQVTSFDETKGSGSPSQPVDDDAFTEAADYITSINASEVPTNSRDLLEYYNRRAYHGAPPIVPHPVDGKSIGGNDCLQCHATGDYVPKYEAYAPVVPHPELLSCNQCHVPVNTADVFVESEWQKLGQFVLGETVLLNSPPPIPHQLQMREDCVSCHAGPAAPAEIRVTHPERENCVQCHVFIETGEEWER